MVDAEGLGSTDTVGAADDLGFHHIGHFVVEDYIGCFVEVDTSTVVERVHKKDAESGFFEIINHALSGFMPSSTQFGVLHLGFDKDLADLGKGFVVGRKDDESTVGVGREDGI